MKRWICVLLCLLTLCLCACGGNGKTAVPTEAPAATAEPEEAVEAQETAQTQQAADNKPQRQSVLPGGTLHEVGAAEEIKETVDVTALVEQAQRFVDKPVAELIAALGEPQSRNYAPSCLGPGEDGELQYEGFTVYTYKNGDAETVKGVE